MMTYYPLQYYFYAHPFEGKINESFLVEIISNLTQDILYDKLNRSF